MELLKMTNITKSFSGVEVLSHVDFSVERGEVHALLGENGAGKSTLMNILAGVHQRDEGEIEFDGEQMHDISVKRTEQAGIAFVHQELNLFNDLKVYENIFLRKELLTKLGTLDKRAMLEQTRQLMSDLADVKRETASVMAEESRIQRQLEEKRQESAKNADLARRALQLSNEDDARVFLAKKQELEKRIEELQKMYDVAHENSMRMRQVHDKLVSDAETLRQRREAIQSKMALARAQEKAANVMGSHIGADESRLGDAIARMEDKADAMLDRSNAMQSLNETPLDPAAELEKKYADGAKNAAVEDELEKMKKEMGL